MAVQAVTKPPVLDETAQTMVTKLQAIATALTRNAGQIDYDNTISSLSATKVQSAIDEVKGITDSLNASLTQLTVVPRIGSVVVTPNANYYDISIAELTSSSQAPWAILGTETGGARVNDVQIVESGKLRVHFSSTISSQTRINYGYFKTFTV